MSLNSPVEKRMNPIEVRATYSLSLVFAFRMLGMFMVLPVMSIYGQHLQYATPALIGLAVGAYGYTQALLQIPLGFLSDRIGRLPIILVGLLVFMLGSVVAALSSTIWGVIAGRVLQGMGAISAAVMALLSDLTRDEQRTKAMAFIGMSIGASFAVAMVTGPIIAYYWGLHGLFWFIAAMALTGFVLMLWVVPKPEQQFSKRDSSVTKIDFMPTLKNVDLLRLDFSIAAVHMVMMASFMALPTVLMQQVGLPKEQHWWVYLVAFICSALGMVPLIIYGEKKRKLKQILCLSVVILLVCNLFFSISYPSLWLIVVGITVFFVAFNTIEALLPSMVSKVAKAGVKGTAMGIFSTSQFLGAALGASLGGVLASMGGVVAIFIGASLFCVLWLFVLLKMQEPPHVTSIRLALLLPQLTYQQQVVTGLLSQDGVTDVVVIPEEPAVYIKFDKQKITAQQLDSVFHEILKA